MRYRKERGSTDRGLQDEVQSGRLGLEVFPMDLIKTGGLIAFLRREQGLTQKQVAERLGVCAKTVSKWETGRGFPDVGLLCELSRIFRVDLAKLISGELPPTKKEAGNVKKTKFYVCEKCGNLLTDLGAAEIVCCGRSLSPIQPREADGAHQLRIEGIEEDFYITFEHPMTKDHYIAFFAFVRFDRVLTLRLYPEQGSEVRFPRMRGGRLYWYCNNHGLFELRI